MTDTLDKLKKAFEQTISTSASVQPWNEPLSRRDAVQAGQNLAGPVVQGGYGSWVGSSGFPLTSTTNLGVQTGAQVPNRNLFELGLGLPGVPDVDFVPYAANTNRFGGKGPALLGHPISWEVVGPTLKSPFCDWQWNVIRVANEILLEAGPSPRLGAVPTVDQAYNLSGSIAANYDPYGGLYVLFSFTGEDFTGSLAGGRTPITPTYKHRAPYEIFRVLSFVGGSDKITLRPEKQLADYYGSGDGCRAITLIRPKVTRLVPFQVTPAGLKGQRNRVFVFVPPETSATSEYMPPFDQGTLDPGVWKNGGFDVNGTIPAGSGNYGGAVALPIPKPLARLTAEIPSGGGFDADTWEIEFATPSAEVTVGRILRISHISDSVTTNVTDGTAANALGYFEITNVVSGPPDVVTLRRVPEANPDTGAVYFGNGPSALAGSIEIGVEVYEPISTLFEGRSVDAEKLSAARLTNLIDPRSVGPSIAYRDTTDPVPASRPDRAIFDTRPGADPGNLLDLGFRAVYFPAKVLGGEAVPDFDNPIDSNEVTLDPTVNERQWIETDYASGVAYLSHAPAAGETGCEVAPIEAPFLATNNPRGEIVLYAACVPYSMEEGQTGTGVRVMASSPDSTTYGLGDNDFADVFGRRIITVPTGSTTIEPGVTTTLITALTDLSAIPPSGFFFVGNVVAGALTSRNGPYFYAYTDLSGPNVRLNGITGPTGAVVVNPAAGGTVYFQRSLRSFDPSEASSDAVRGSSKRTNTLVFKNFGLEFTADGSVIVSSPTGAGGSTLQSAYEAGNTIAVTAAEGTVSISNAADTTNALTVSRSFAGGGAGIFTTMGVGTTGLGVSVEHYGSGIGMSVSAASGDGVVTSVNDAIGVYADAQGSGAGARGAFFELTSPTATGAALEASTTGGTANGILVNYTGSGAGLAVDYLSGTNTAVSVGIMDAVGYFCELNGTGPLSKGILIQITDNLSFASGIVVENAGSGPGVSVTTDGNGVGVYVRQNGSGDAISVADSGGVEVFAVDEFGRVDSEGYGYKTAKTFVTRISAPEMQATNAADWVFNYNPVGGVGGPGWEKISAGGSSIYGALNLPRGASITAVHAALNNPGAGMTVGILAVSATTGTPTTPWGNAAATAGFGNQIISPVGLPLTLITGNNYYVYFQSVSGNAVHWVDVYWTYSDVTLSNF